MVEYVFDHEKLKVYQKSIEFVEWSERIIKRIKIKGAIVDQFDRLFVQFLLILQKEMASIQIKIDADILILQKDLV